MVQKMSSEIPISVAIITKNEEERLPACLKSVSFADEVVVVDSGSVDETLDVARSFGAKIFIEEWRGFSDQKQFAVNQCNNVWVLILDADERIPEATANIIKREIASDEQMISAYSFRRKNYFHGKWIKHCGWWPDRIVRLVNRKKGGFDGRRVHESWLTEGRVEELDASIEHVSFQNYSELVAKMENYSNLAAAEMFEQGIRANPFTPILHGIWMFIRTYILEKGIFDGFDGFMISAMNAGGSFMKYAKLREKQIEH
ncbi:MAG: glycosyltransferase family 2 protein [Deltaproteobacteria bacterium]|nr:glycosyltransferase family 2 protein [Deltaproteobacteria bacterium]